MVLSSCYFVFTPVQVFLDQLTTRVVDESLYLRGEFGPKIPSSQWDSNPGTLGFLCRGATQYTTENHTCCRCYNGCRHVSSDSMEIKSTNQMFNNNKNCTVLP